MNGVLIFDKPKGITSHDVVYIVRKKLGIKKVGHTGTLDPIATGVLPILIGKATKISDRLIAHTKEYLAEFEFGYQTDTLDNTGVIINKSEVIPSKEQINQMITKFIGEIEQQPPIYSAKKINGKKLYEYARAGEHIEIPTQKCMIFDLKLISENSGKYSIYVNCSSGTYIRSLIRDIGLQLNAYATMTNLRRISAGNFNVEMAMSKDIFDNSSIEEIQNRLLAIDEALNLESIILPDSFYKKITNGVFCPINNIYNSEYEYNIYCGDEYIGIGKYDVVDNQKGIKIVKKLM